MKARLAISAIAALLALTVGQLAQAACCGAVSYGCCDDAGAAVIGGSGGGCLISSADQALPSFRRTKVERRRVEHAY